MRTIILTAALVSVATPGVAQVPTITSQDSASHVLNRLAFGPAPGQIEAVAAEGVLRWVDRQLQFVGSDQQIKERERRFSLLERSPADLGRQFREVRLARTAAQRKGSSAMEGTAKPGPTPAGIEFRGLIGQLATVTLVRATMADHQLFEVMTDFWVNHFNVFSGKNLVPVYLADYLNRTIRPHALGRFEDLLIAVAKSPAMLVYLDNAQSVTPGSKPPELARLRTRGRASRPRADSAMARLAQRMPTGLNENYARELLELHTLGVDGGYTQDDVIAAARILTGWTIDRGLRRGGIPGGFIFNSWAHDRTAKTVLGANFPAGQGEGEGLELLRMLARHPATIHHLSTKLCRRLVADAAPDGCIDNAVRAWHATDGTIAEVIRAIVRSPDFWSAANVNTKIKTPLEFVVSAVRALGGDPDTSRALVGAAARLGQPLFLQPVPTGYPETQADWVNSGALLARMNFAVALAGGRLRGVRLDLDAIVAPTADQAALIDRVDQVILAGRMTPNTRSVIAREIAGLTDPAAARALAVGLAVGGPEFQRQ